jgi:methylmalonyl-CoA/ethylmalonyl-CoA epimerase
MSFKDDILCRDIEFEHIGVAASSIKECLNILGNLFELKEIPEIYEDTLQNIKISFINLAGAKIELIEPLDSNKKSPVDNIIKKNMSYYHLCFRTGCLEKTVSQLLEKGAVEVIKPIPASAFGNRKIAFLYVKHLGLIELVEREK